MSNKFKIAVVSNVGNSRPNQEDNFIIARDRYLTPEIRQVTEAERKTLASSYIHDGPFVIAVSDGMGGHASGEVASLATVEYISRHYDDFIRAASQGREEITKQIATLNYRVAELAARQGSVSRSMGATLVGAVETDGEMYGFNAGDSRIYKLSCGELKQLSTDHTEGQRLLGLGLLTEEEVENLPHRKSIYKYIGIPKAELRADVFKLDGMEEGDLLLLCSDGLSDVLSGSELAEILNEKTSLEERASALLDMAINRREGRGDNITAVLAEKERSDVL